MAAKSANPVDLIPAKDIWLHNLTQSNDKILQEAVVDVGGDQGGPCRPTCIKIGNRASGLKAMY